MDRGDERVLRREVAVERVVGEPGGGHDVGDPGPRVSCPHRRMTVEGGVEQAAHLVGVGGLPPGQGLLGDPLGDAVGSGIVFCTPRILF